MKSHREHLKKVSVPVILVVGVISLVLLSLMTSPRETVGPTPTLLFPDVPLEGAFIIEGFRWSPSGDFLLIEAVAPTGEHEDGLTVILEPENRAVVARIPDVRHTFWGKDDSVWAWAKDHWAVYAPPFVSSSVWESGYESFSEHWLDGKSWDLSPFSKRLAATSGGSTPDASTIRIFEDGKESFALEINPEYRNGSSRTPRLTFSPTGRFLAAVFSGWIGYESPGPEEFWLVDVEEQRVAHIHTGKDRWWQIVDGDTQRLDPSWTQSEDAVVYADPVFGIEELSIPAAEPKTIVGKGSEVHIVIVSPTGRWIAFERWPGEKEDIDRYDRCFGAVSRDGRRILHLPREFINWPYMYKDWHPEKDGLAVLRRNPGQLTHDLFYWDLSNSGRGKRG